MDDACMSRFAIIQNKPNQKGFILPIVLSIILVITLLASSSTDVLRINYRIEQSKDRQHVAHQRAKEALVTAKTYLLSLSQKPSTEYDIKRNKLDLESPVLWDGLLSTYYLLEEKDKITKQPLSHYVQNHHWWKSYGNPVLSTKDNLGKATGYNVSEKNDYIGYYIIEDFDEVIENTELSHNTDYHKRPSSTLYAITTFGDFDTISSSRIQSYYIKNYY